MEQIGSAHDRGNALKSIIYHDGELICMQPVPATNDEVSNFC